MLGPRRTRRVLLLVGLVLLANGVWLYPDDVSHERRYTYEAERVEYPPDGDYRIEIRNCDWHPLQSRECAIVRALARNTTLRLDLQTGVSDDLIGTETYYDTLDGWYRPVTHVENGTMVLGMEPVAQETVMRAAADDFSEASPAVRTAIRDGSVTTTREIPDWHTFVVRNGTYYQVRFAAMDRYPTGWGWRDPSPTAVGTMRALAWLGGLVAIWYAGVLFGWRYRDR